jgi:hypothetical protein
MSKGVKKATPIRFHEGLQQLRKDAGGMDIGAGEIWVDVGWKTTLSRFAALRRSRPI